MDHDCGPGPAAGAPAVGHLIDAFADHCRAMAGAGQLTPATVAWYAAALKKLRAAAGDLPAAALRPRHLAGVRFTAHFVRAVKALYRWAADDDQQLVPRNPFRALPTPPAGQRTRTLKRPEMARLYRASSADWRRFLFVAARTLARPGELRNLRWRDVHLDQRLILLTEFKSKAKRKDGVGVRTIPLDRPTARLLGNMHRRAGGPGPDAHVFLGRGGRPFTKYAARCRMRRAREKAGLDAGGGERVVCYTLRHTGATEATRRGIRDNTLARVMGHATTRTTARYQHLDPADLVAAIDRAAARRPSPGGR